MDLLLEDRTVDGAIQPSTLELKWLSIFDPIHQGRV
jgi:hypothetical protein